MSTVEGADAITAMFAKMPKEMQAETKRSMRASARIWLTKMRAAVPAEHPQWKAFSKVSVRSKKGIVSCLVGFFGPAEVHFEWMKAYWYTYGTLLRRDPSHKFDNPIRRRKRRNNLGQKANNWFDPATAGADQDIVDHTIRDLENYIDRL